MTGRGNGRTQTLDVRYCAGFDLVWVTGLFFRFRMRINRPYKLDVPLWGSERERLVVIGRKAQYFPTLCVFLSSHYFLFSSPLVCSMFSLHLCTFVLPHNSGVTRILKLIYSHFCVLASLTSAMLVHKAYTSDSDVCVKITPFSRTARIRILVKCHWIYNDADLMSNAVRNRSWR